MKHRINMERGRMTERQVRDAIEKATHTARIIDQQRGKSDPGHERTREKMIQNAERDRKEGKI